MRDCRVASFEFEGLKIVFEKSVQAPAEAAAPVLEVPAGAKAETPTGIRTEKIEDAVVPQGLEEELTPDKILNWSAPCPDQSVPLTDDEPMSGLPEASANV